MGAMGEAAVSLPVTTMIGPGLLADGQGGRPPEVSGVVVAQIDGLSGRIGDRVVRPGRELVLPAILRPGVAGARLRDLEPQSLVGDHVDPRGGRPLALAERDHVFAAVLDEAAQPVAELPHGTRRRAARARPVPRAKVAARACASARAAQRAPPARRGVPWRLRRMTRAAAVKQSRSPGERRSPRRTKTEPPWVAREGGPARSDQPLERPLEILKIRRRLLVEDDQVDREPLQPPVLVRAQELADDAAVLHLVDANEHDGQIAGDPVRPERGGAERVAHEHRGGRAHARSRHEGCGWPAAGRGAPPPRRCPRWWSCTCAWVQARVAIRSKVAGSRYLSAMSRAAGREVASRVENTMRALAPGARRSAPPQAEDRVQHGARGIGERPALDHRHGRADPAPPPQEPTRGPSRAASPRRSFPPPPSRGRPRCAPPRGSG